MMMFESGPEDLPLHPVTIRWLTAYARAADAERA